MEKKKTDAGRNKKHVVVYYINNIFYVPLVYKVHWAFDHIGETYGTASISSIDSLAELIESCPAPLPVDIEEIKSMKELDKFSSSVIDMYLKIDRKCTPCCMAGYKSISKFNRDSSMLNLAISRTHTSVLYDVQNAPEGTNFQEVVLNTGDSKVIAKWICSNLNRFGPQPKMKKKYGEKTELIDVSNLK